MDSLRGMMGIALGQPFVTIPKPDDFKSLVNPFNGGGTNDAIDAGRRAAPYQNCEFSSVDSVCHIKFKFKVKFNGPPWRFEFPDGPAQFEPSDGKRQRSFRGRNSSGFGD